jgi:hypothetical protein
MPEFTSKEEENRWFLAEAEKALKKQRKRLAPEPEPEPVVEEKPKSPVHTSSHKEK